MKQQITCPVCKGQKVQESSPCTRCGGLGVLIVTISEDSGSKPRITRIIQE